jgi:hypothetical protein
MCNYEAQNRITWHSTKLEIVLKYKVWMRGTWASLNYKYTQLFGLYSLQLGVDEDIEHV